MSQNLDLVVAAKNATDAAFQQLAGGLEKAKQKTKETEQELEKFSLAGQRAAMRMEAMHAQALQMNTGFSSTDDKAQRFSATLGAVSTTATASAAALGLPIGQLGGLNAATDVAALGFGKLTKASVGFNTASVGVVGAGLAIGVAIGTMLRQFGEAENFLGLSTKEADRQIAELAGKMGFFKKATEGATLAALGFASATDFENKMGAIQAQVRQNVINLMRSQHKTTDEIIAQLQGKHIPTIDKLVGSLKEEEKAQGKAAEAVKRAAEVYANAAEQARTEWDKFYKEMSTRSTSITRQMQDDIAKAAKKIMEDRAKQAAEELKLYAEMDKHAAAREKEEQERLKRETEEWKKAQEKKREALIRSFHDMAGAIGSFGDLFVTLGGKADSAFGKLLTGASILADTIGNVLSNMGNPIAMIGAGLSGLVGLIGSVFGDKEHEQVNDMRDAFFEAEGGFEILQERLLSVTDQDLVKRIFDAKTVKDFEAAVAEVNALFDLQAQAQEELYAAIEKYGFSIDELGPKWRQQELDKLAAQLLKEYELLTESGIDHTLVIEKMGANLVEYVETSRKAGTAIPEAMRPIIERMIEQGLLLDENGQAFGSVEEAGLSFTQTMSEQFKTLIERIDDLVSALLGIPNITRTVTINEENNTSGGHGNDGNHDGGHGFATGGWFPYRPHGYNINVGEAGDEAVLNEPQIRKLVAEGVAMAGGSQPAGGGAPVVIENRIYLSGQPMLEWISRQHKAGYLDLG